MPHAELAEADLPGSLSEIKEVIGLDATINLVRAFGGTRIYVPAKMGPGHKLIAALGEEASTALSKRFKGEEIAVPRAAKALKAVRDREMCILYDTGTSVPNLAKKFQLTERQVYTILSKTIFGSA